MQFLFVHLVLLFRAVVMAQGFSCPAGQADVMKYFVMTEARRSSQFLQGDPNPIYTQMFPNRDFPTLFERENLGSPFAPAGTWNQGAYTCLDCGR